MANAADAATNPIDNYYDFVINGNLTSNYIISVGHYANTETGIIALSGVSSEIVEANASFEYSGIASFSASGVNYTLVSVNINNRTLSPEEIAIIQANDKITGIATGNVDIDLYYTVVAEEVAEEEVAE